MAFTRHVFVQNSNPPPPPNITSSPNPLNITLFNKTSWPLGLCSEWYRVYRVGIKVICHTDTVLICWSRGHDIILTIEAVRAVRTVMSPITCLCLSITIDYDNNYWYNSILLISSPPPTTRPAASHSLSLSIPSLVHMKIIKVKEKQSCRGVP